MAQTRGSYPADDAGEEGSALLPSRPDRSHRRGLTNVLIVGGTVEQRDQVARTFHLESPLRAGPFVAVDCRIDRDRLRMALRAWTVAESESATNPFRAAEEGTLYLDPAEEIPPDTQPILYALTRRLQGGLVGAGGWPCAGRLIVGNPRSLAAVVSEGRFDPALYEALDRVRVDLGPEAPAPGSGSQCTDD